MTELARSRSTTAPLGAEASSVSEAARRPPVVDAHCHAGHGDGLTARGTPTRPSSATAGGPGPPASTGPC